MVLLGLECIPDDDEMEITDSGVSGVGVGVDGRRDSSSCTPLFSRLPQIIGRCGVFDSESETSIPRCLFKREMGFSKFQSSCGER
jgi:hypothetical protein